MCAELWDGIAEVRDADRRYVNPNPVPDPRAHLFSSDLLPELEASTVYLAADRTSWRKHPLRRLSATRQGLQIALGDWMLNTFPFLRPPAEWAVRQLDRLPRRRR